MTIQAAPFAPDIQWFLDCALEHGELDAGTHLALRFYATRSEVMAIVDEVPPIGHYLGPPIPQRLRTTELLARLADTLLASLPLDRRGAVAWAGIQHIKTEIDSLAWCCATWAIEDGIKGGCLQPYKRNRHPPRWQRDYEIGPKLRRRLYGQNWIRRYVKRNEDAQRLRQKGTRALERMRGIDLAAVRAAGDVLARDIQAQHENYRRWNELMLRQMARLGDHDRRQERSRRRVIKRAASTAVALIGRDPVSQFVAGQPVTLKGETLDLEIGRTASAATIGHLGLHVTAVCPATGRRLADLCVYHERTPALDQLTALSLAMRAGEEAEIIRTANLSRVSEAGRAHPLIQDRGLPERAWRPHDEVRIKNEAYWQDTRQMWIEALGVFVLGRAWGWK